MCIVYRLNSPRESDLKMLSTLAATCVSPFFFKYDTCNLSSSLSSSPSSAEEDASGSSTAGGPNPRGDFRGGLSSGSSSASSRLHTPLLLPTPGLMLSHSAAMAVYWSEE